MFERLRSGGSPYAKLKLNRAEESHVLHVLHGLHVFQLFFIQEEKRENDVLHACIAWIAWGIACQAGPLVAYSRNKIPPGRANDRRSSRAFKIPPGRAFSRAGPFRRSSRAFSRF